MINSEELIFSLKKAVADKSAMRSSYIKNIHYVWIGGEIKSEYIFNLSNVLKLNAIAGVKTHLWTDNKSRDSNVKEFKTLAEQGLEIRQTENLIKTLITTPNAFGLDASSLEYILKTLLFEYAAPENYGTISDIFRLMILFEEGGLYLDIDLKLRYSFGLLDTEILNKEIKTLKRNHVMAITSRDLLLKAQKNRELEKLNDFAGEDDKQAWIVNQFYDFLNEMEKLYPMGAREDCNDIIVAEAGHTKLTSILKDIAKIMLKKRDDINMLNAKKDPSNYGVFVKKSIELGPGAMWEINDFLPTAKRKEVCEDYLIVKHDNNWITASNAAANLTKEKTTILEIVEILRQKIFNESFEGLAQQAITSDFILAKAAQKILSGSVQSTVSKLR